jgi:hypothetical protein
MVKQEVPNLMYLYVMDSKIASLNGGDKAYDVVQLKQQQPSFDSNQSHFSLLTSTFDSNALFQNFIFYSNQVLLQTSKLQGDG